MSDTQIINGITEVRIVDDAALVTVVQQTVDVELAGPGAQLALTAAALAQARSNEAATARTAAEMAQTIAQAAALTAPMVYSSTAAGLAAAADQGTFWVSEVQGIALYRDVSGVATLIGRFPNTTAFAVNTPQSRGGISAGATGVSESVLVGGYGTFSSAATVPVRAAWSAIGADPTVGANSLSLTGHQINSATDTAIMIGGRSSYYSHAGIKASLSATYGGDNYNGHLAGMIFAFHSDLVDDGLGNGDHGAIFGGSFKCVGGSYAGSFAGTVHKVFGLQSVALGGKNIAIGTEADAIVVRRSGTLGGLNNNLATGYESTILGGQGHLLNGDRSAILGGEDHIIASSYAAAIGGRRNKTTAIGATVFGQDAVGSVEFACTQSAGKFASPGDSQVHYVGGRRTFTGVTNFLSNTGGSGVDVFTPPANTVGTFVLAINAVRMNGAVAFSPAETASYLLQGSFSNVGGTLVIKGQTLTPHHEDNAAYNAAAEIVGAGTRLGVRVTTPGATHVTRWTYSGTITVQSVI